MFLRPERLLLIFHDSKIFSISRRENDLEMSLASMVIVENNRTFAIDKPRITCHDLIDIEASNDYSVRIMAFYIDIFYRKEIEAIWDRKDKVEIKE